MTILTKDEIDTCALDGCRDDYAFAEEVEKTVLAKLAGMEMPEPEVIDRHIPTNTVIRGYTAAQLHQAFAQGAASQLSSEPVAWCDVVMNSAYTSAEIDAKATNYYQPLYTLKAPK